MGSYDIDKAPSGLEPLLRDHAAAKRQATEPVASQAGELSADLQRVVERIMRREGERR
jgi:hypothetical protein